MCVHLHTSWIFFSTLLICTHIFHKQDSKSSFTLGQHLCMVHTINIHHYSLNLSSHTIFLCIHYHYGTKRNFCCNETMLCKIMGYNQRNLARILSCALSLICTWLNTNLNHIRVLGDYHLLLFTERHYPTIGSLRTLHINLQLINERNCFLNNWTQIFIFKWSTVFFLLILSVQKLMTRISFNCMTWIHFYSEMGVLGSDIKQ